MILKDGSITNEWYDIQSVMESESMSLERERDIIMNGTWYPSSEQKATNLVNPFKSKLTGGTVVNEEFTNRLPYLIKNNLIRIVKPIGFRVGYDETAKRSEKTLLGSSECSSLSALEIRSQLQKNIILPETSWNVEKRSYPIIPVPMIILESQEQNRKRLKNKPQTLKGFTKVRDFYVDYTLTSKQRTLISNHKRFQDSVYIGPDIRYSNYSIKKSREELKNIIYSFGFEPYNEVERTGIPYRLMVIINKVRDAVMNPYRTKQDNEMLEEVARDISDAIDLLSREKEIAHVLAGWFIQSSKDLGVKGRLLLRLLNFTNREDYFTSDAVIYVSEFYGFDFETNSAITEETLIEVADDYKRSLVELHKPGVREKDIEDCLMAIHEVDVSETNSSVSSSYIMLDEATNWAVPLHSGCKKLQTLGPTNYGKSLYNNIFFDIILAEGYGTWDEEMSRAYIDDLFANCQVEVAMFDNVIQPTLQGEMASSKTTSGSILHGDARISSIMINRLDEVAKENRYKPLAYCPISTTFSLWDYITIAPDGSRVFLWNGAEKHLEKINIILSMNALDLPSIITETNYRNMYNADNISELFYVSDYRSYNPLFSKNIMGRI